MTICFLPRELFQLTILENEYIPQEPTEKQAQFLLELSEEALYGGAAGGGKSSSLLMTALQYVNIPNYSALVLRRTYPDLSLPDAIMDRAHKWLVGTNAVWIASEKTWKFPSGATLTFGYLDTANDKYRYQGAAFQCICFDEVTQFLENDYLYLYSRLRRLAGSIIPIRMRCAGNPGGRGHQWVKDRFIDGDRVFYPASLKDNPHLDRDEYVRALSKLDPVTREQLLNGNWNVAESGNKFKREWFEIVDATPAESEKVRFWDMAATSNAGDWTVGALLGVYRDVVYVIDVQRFQGTPGTVETIMFQTAELDGPDVKIRWEEEGGASGKFVTSYFVSELIGYDAKGIRATGSKIVRANPFSSFAEAGNVKLQRAHWNKTFLEELGLFPAGSHDDIVDACSGAFSEIAKTKRSSYEPTINEAFTKRISIPEILGI